MKNKNIEKLIIKKATELAKNDFASGYDQIANYILRMQYTTLLANN